MPFIYLKFVLLVLVNISAVCSSNCEENSDYKIIKKISNLCSSDPDKYSCLADKAAMVVEHLMTKDVAVFDDIILTKYKSLRRRTPRKWDNGISRFLAAIANFFNTHTLTYDLSYDEPRLFDGKKKGGKKGGKDLYYVMWVMFGIFGITGPLVMKTLALMAGKALIASKMALLIVGSIAIKKIFDHDHGNSKVKVVNHNSNDDDLDRNYNAGPYKYFSPT